MRDLQEALGEAYLAAGDYVLAADWYSLALDHDPLVHALRVRLAFAQSLSGAHLEALRTIRDVPRDTQVPPYVQIALGRSALMIDEGPEATYWFRGYLDALPGKRGTIASTAYSTRHQETTAHTKHAGQESYSGTHPEQDEYVDGYFRYRKIDAHGRDPMGIG